MKLPHLPDYVMDFPPTQHTLSFFVDDFKPEFIKDFSDLLTLIRKPL